MQQLCYTPHSGAKDALFV